MRSYSSACLEVEIADHGAPKQCRERCPVLVLKVPLNHSVRVYQINFQSAGSHVDPELGTSPLYLLFQCPFGGVQHPFASVPSDRVGHPNMCTFFSVNSHLCCLRQAKIVPVAVTTDG